MGVTKDLERALFWCEKAAETGDLEALQVINQISREIELNKSV